MSSIEPLIKLLMVLKTRKKCMKLMKMVMLSFLKSRRERKTKRKLKLSEKNNKKLHRKFLPKRRKKVNHLLKVKRKKGLLVKPSQSNLPPKLKLKKNRKEKNTVRSKKVEKANLKSLFLRDHLRAESINLLTRFPMCHSISQEEVFSRSTNLL